jgi:hypothetical protein
MLNDAISERTAILSIPHGCFNSGQSFPEVCILALRPLRIEIGGRLAGAHPSQPISSRHWNGTLMDTT